MEDEMDYEDDATTAEQTPAAVEPQDTRSVKIQRTVTQVWKLWSRMPVLMISHTYLTIVN